MRELHVPTFQWVGKGGDGVCENAGLTEVGAVAEEIRTAATHARDDPSACEGRFREKRMQKLRVAIAHEEGDLLGRPHARDTDNLARHAGAQVEHHAIELSAASRKLLMEARELPFGHLHAGKLTPLKEPHRMRQSTRRSHEHLDQTAGKPPITHERYGQTLCTH